MGAWGHPHINLGFLSTYLGLRFGGVFSSVTLMCVSALLDGRQKIKYFGRLFEGVGAGGTRVGSSILLVQGCSTPATQHFAPTKQREFKHPTPTPVALEQRAGSKIPPRSQPKRLRSYPASPSIDYLSPPVQGSWGAEELEVNRCCSRILAGHSGVQQRSATRYSRHTTYHNWVGQHHHLASISGVC